MALVLGACAQPAPELPPTREAMAASPVHQPVSASPATLVVSPPDGKPLGVPSMPAVHTHSSGRREALVIGNASYELSMGKLLNPVHDATDLASVLKALRFNVTLVLNAKKTELERIIKT